MDMQVDKAADRLSFESSAVIPKRTLRERLRRPLMIAFPLLLLTAGAAAYLTEEPYVATDDAFVRAAKESVNARVSGQVIRIDVKDNQRVRTGQVLFQIDPEPFQIAVDQAQADLRSARLQIEGLKTKYRQQLAELEAARDSANFAAREYNRKKALVASVDASRSTYERTETDLQVAQQAIVSMEQQIAGTVVALNGDPDVNVDSHPSVLAAKARLDRARLDLSYAQVVAPDDGVVTKVDDLQVGDFVNPGAAVFSLMSSRRIWIEANFRETGLTHMQPGQPAVIDADAYPGHTFKAHIVSMSPGTGSDFSVLPPENATGNWVKVVQRLPVRLELDSAQTGPTLYSGLSVTARVDTGYRWTPWRPLQAAQVAGANP